LRPPELFSIPPHIAFVDALAKGVLARCGDDPLALAQAHILLPNRRAARALTEAFVRLSGTGLLLPRLTPVGDLGDDSFDRFANGDNALPPAVAPLRRRLELARLVRAMPAARELGRSAVEALRLGDALGATLDALLAEEIAPERLNDVVADQELAVHWQQTLAFLDIVITAWPPARDALGSDGGTRVAALIDALLVRWQAAPPPGLVIAAGVTGSSPPLVRLLAGVLALPQGLVVLPGLDTDVSEAGEARWAAIAVGDPDDSPVRDSEEHPQHALKALLARLRLDRSDVRDWGETTERDGPQARTALVQAAMAPADAADGWHSGSADPAGLSGIRAVEAATPAEEAQVIALALREALEVPAKTAALVTPDRVLARRVAAHCRRWGIDLDDSAGTPLRLTPPGALVLALVEAMAQGFAPVPLLAALKHPLVAAGDGRGDWLAEARRLDRDLRGVRPLPGLEMIGERIEAMADERLRRLRRDGAEAAALAASAEQATALAGWWHDAAEVLAPLAAIADRGGSDLARLAAALRETGTALCGDALWRGSEGRALASLIERLETDGAVFGGIDLEDLPGVMAALLSDIAVRNAWGGHPRLAILGPLEAQLQRADLMILGGLNEGVWPGRPAPDPWLAPAIRRALGLPGLARATGLAAHDFVGALGAGEVLLTRARRDAASPLVPSRFWLRLQAFTGGLSAADDLLTLARRIDGHGQPHPSPPPRPVPPVAARPQQLWVTEVDTLRIDPFAFYAKRLLGLSPLDPLDQDPTAATRGTRIHEVLENWVGSGRGSLDRLAQLTEAMLADEGRQFPLLRALWAPRARRALLWAGEQILAAEAGGWTEMVPEASGKLTLPNGIVLQGRADRVDRHAEGGLAVIDYKTGRAPSPTQVRAGLANQLGLLLAMACGGAMRSRAGAVAGGTPAAIAYWQLPGGREAGKIVDALKGKPPLSAEAHVELVLDDIEQLTTQLLQTPAAFEAKREPVLAWGDYDHLARVPEWLDRPQRRAR
jgi:ATP-dependent helicase/nuclease subunit B